MAICVVMLHVDVPVSTGAGFGLCSFGLSAFGA